LSGSTLLLLLSGAPVGAAAARLDSGVWSCWWTTAAPSRAAAQGSCRGLWGAAGWGGTATCPPPIEVAPGSSGAWGGAGWGGTADTPTPTLPTYLTATAVVASGFFDQSQSSVEYI
jgi:hypothetical protein